MEPGLAHEGHFRREPGLYLGARPRYVERHADPAALRRRASSACSREEFDLIAGAHSRPFRDDPRAALARLIETAFREQTAFR